MKFRITDTDVYGECNEDFFFAYEGYEKEERIISGVSLYSRNPSVFQRKRRLSCWRKIRII